MGCLPKWCYECFSDISYTIGLLRNQEAETCQRNKYSKGEAYISIYNFILIICFIGYISYCVSTDGHQIGLMGAASIVLMVATLIKSLINHDLRLLYYTFAISLLPSLITSLLSAFFSHVPEELFTEYVLQWTCSNYILLQTAGYLMYQIFFVHEVKMISNRQEIAIDLSTIAYYISILVWNVLIILMIANKSVRFNPSIYFFPWALGNTLQLMNLYFSTFHDAEEADDKFKWYEQQVIVVEKNTNAVITMIAFMLPLSFTLLAEVPPILPVFFIANIFCACMSIGLIWTPKANVKFIALLKSLKTIFYTYSITLLMLCVIMIMSYL